MASGSFAVALTKLATASAIQRQPANTNMLPKSGKKSAENGFH